MKKKFIIIIIFLAVSVPGVIMFGAATGYCQDSEPGFQIPEGVYIKLTKDFYEALREEGVRGTKVYGNDPSDEYLKRISISARFMVETNLQILRQQERIIRLLQDLSWKREK